MTIKPRLHGLERTIGSLEDLGDECLRDLRAQCWLWERLVEFEQQRRAEEMAS